MPSPNINLIHLTKGCPLKPIFSKEASKFQRVLHEPNPKTLKFPSIMKSQTQPLSTWAPITYSDFYDSPARSKSAKKGLGVWILTRILVILLVILTIRHIWETLLKPAVLIPHCTFQSSGEIFLKILSPRSTQTNSIWLSRGGYFAKLPRWF